MDNDVHRKVRLAVLETARETLKKIPWAPKETRQGLRV